MFYVDSYQKKYIPAKNDNIIGIIQSKTPEFFWVDISYSELASKLSLILSFQNLTFCILSVLPYLAFEGATKKNRPEINVGDLVYAKVVLANPDLEAELVCVDSTGKKGKLGELKDGLMFTCSINLVRKILNDKCNLLHLLSKECPYEIVAGINGRIWINTKSLRTTILLRDTILEAEHTAYNEMKDLVDKFAGELTGIKS